jgi:hypothetical protein
MILQGQKEDGKCIQNYSVMLSSKHKTLANFKPVCFITLLLVPREPENLNKHSANNLNK